MRKGEKGRGGEKGKGREREGEGGRRCVKRGKTGEFLKGKNRGILVIQNIFFHVGFEAKFGFATFIKIEIDNLIKNFRPNEF